MAVTALAEHNLPISDAVIDESTADSHTIVAAVAGHRIRLLSYVVVADGPTELTWKSGTTAKSGPMSLAANGGVSASAAERRHLLATEVGEALVLASSAAEQIGGHITYTLTRD